jgi:hypothetical protein
MLYRYHNPKFAELVNENHLDFCGLGEEWADPQMSGCGTAGSGEQA